MRVTTERLVLREFVEEDWAALLGYHKFIAQQEEEKPRLKYQLAVTLKVVGCVGLWYA
jgi:hypothetical protein